MKLRWAFPRLTFTSLTLKKDFTNPFGIKSCSTRLSSSYVSAKTNSISQLSLSLFKDINQPDLYLQSCRLFCDESKNLIDNFSDNVSYEQLTVDKFKELIKSDQDGELIERILASYEIVKYETGMVPSTLTLENMANLLQIKYHKREPYFLNLFYRELSKYRKKAKNKPLPERHPHLELERAAGQQQFMGVRFDGETGGPLYGEWLNSHFLRLRKSELIHSVESNLIAGYMFGPKLVIDCDYDLNPVEAKKIVWDISYTLKAIGQQADPFNLILTGPFNESYKKVLDQVLVSSSPNLGYLGVQTQEQHFLDLFPQEKIIYLSPYSSIPLTSYDSETIYVLGGLPDIQSVNIRLGSLRKIKSLKLKSRRLPLDDYFVFKTTKRLSLHECINIMDHLSTHGNMAAALKHGVHPGRYKSEQDLKIENDERTLRILKKSFRNIHNQVDYTENSA